MLIFNEESQTFSFDAEPFIDNRGHFDFDRFAEAVQSHQKETWGQWVERVLITEREPSKG